jgi:uncharacterized protein (DUF1778 family)
VADSVAPTTFRLPAKERRLLEAVAHASDQTLSSFIRDAAMSAAHGVLAREGIEEVLRKDKLYLERQQGKYTAQLAEHEEVLYEHAGGRDDRTADG